MLARNPHTADAYRLRLLACLAVVLLGLGLLVRLWPARAPLPARLPTQPERITVLEQIVVTRQGATPPPPAAPLPVEVEPVIADVPPPVLDAPPMPAPPTAAATPDSLPGSARTASPAAASGITRAPVPVHMVQPQYTAEAQRRRVRAEAIVAVRVDTQGRVASAEIRERYLLEEGSEKRSVPALEYGLETAALEAARRWLFRPALREGLQVEQTYLLTLRWGTSR